MGLAVLPRNAETLKNSLRLQGDAKKMKSVEDGAVNFCDPSSTPLVVLSEKDQHGIPVRALFQY